MSNEPALIMSDKNDTRLVRLSHHYSSSGGFCANTGIDEYFAEINAGGTTFWKMSTDTPPQEFHLSMDDAESFAHALLAYQGDQIKREQAELDDFNAKVEAARARATRQGATLTQNDRSFDLIFEQHSKWNRHWNIEDNLLLSTVIERLDMIEKYTYSSYEQIAKEGINQ